MKLLGMYRLRQLTVAATVTWGMFVGVGFLVLQLHNAAPGQGGRAVEHWPALSRVPLNSRRSTLVMAAHPLCPCTRASVSELDPRFDQVRRARSRSTFSSSFPSRAGHGWGPTDGLRRLGTMAGVHLIDDPGGEEATRFGALTSGLVALYAPDGRLLFRGGITGARGHEGDNEGRRSLVGLIEGNSSSFPGQTPVFGCPLFQVHSISAESSMPWK